MAARLVVRGEFCTIVALARFTPVTFPRDAMAPEIVHYAIQRVDGGDVPEVRVRQVQPPHPFGLLLEIELAHQRLRRGKKTWPRTV